MELVLTPCALPSPLPPYCLELVLNTSTLAVGDWCAMHWDWVCDRLSPTRLAALRRYSTAQLALADLVALKYFGVAATTVAGGAYNSLTTQQKRQVADAKAIRRTASRNKLPVERITEVRVLDPYFYK